MYPSVYFMLQGDTAYGMYSVRFFTFQRYIFCVCRLPGGEDNTADDLVNPTLDSKIS